MAKVTSTISFIATARRSGFDNVFSNSAGRALGRGWRPQGPKSEKIPMIVTITDRTAGAMSPKVC
jgi:hypothetical protein